MIELLKPIAGQLKTIFPGVTRYSEDQPQGVEKPCFFVKIIRTELRPQLNNFYILNNTVSITYLSDEKNQFKAEDIRFKLLMGLRSIQLNNAGIHAVNQVTEIRENKDVIYTADYNIWFEEKQIPETLMKKLKQTGGFKE